jgi:hypothetical protein
MNKNIKFGIIKNLKSENFLFGGIAYLKNEKIFKNGKFIDNENIVDFISGVDKTSARINMNFAFAKKIEEIKNKRKDLDERKTERYENIKINEYFKEKKNSILDIVMIAQTPIKYDDTELIAKFSLIYFELESGKNIGFFVNKTLASILFTEVED